MITELVAVGTEILLGNIVNTNSAYLADALLLDTSKEAQDAVENHSMMLSAKELFPVLETMKQIRQYGDSTDKNYGYRDEGSMFNSGNTAMYINGVWASKLIDEKSMPAMHRFRERMAARSPVLPYVWDIL